MANRDTTLNIIIDARNRTEKAFSKAQNNMKRMSGSVENTSKTLKQFGKYGAVAFAAVSAASSKLVKDAAYGLQIEESYRRMTGEMGISADNLTKKLQEASAGTVSATDLMLSANRAMALGVGNNMATITNLMEIARLKGRAMGLDTTQAFDNIVTGIGRASPLILDNLGITIKQVEAQEQYAQKLGKSAAELTDAEKKQALLNAVLQEGNAQLKSAGVVTKTVYEQMQTLKARFADTADALGRALVPAMVEFLDTVTPIVEKVGKWATENPQLFSTLVKVTLAVSGLVAVLGAIGVVLPAVVTGVGALSAAFLALSGPVGWIIGAFGLAAVAIYKVRSALTETAGPTFQLTEQYTGLQTTLDETTASSDGFTNALSGVSDEAQKAASKIKELQDRAKDVFDTVFKGEADSKRDLAEAIVAQEEKIHDIKKELRGKEKELRKEDDRDRKGQLKAEVDDLNAKLQTESQALQTSANLRTRLRSEITEANRRADLTDFERMIEDIQRRRVERLKEQLARLIEIQQEIAAEKAKNSAITKSFAQAQEAMREQSAKTTEAIVFDIKQVEKEAKKAFNAITSLSTARSTPSTRGLSGSRASGGPVFGGGSYLVGEEGPEIFTPQSSGYITPNKSLPTTSLVITGNTFLSEEVAEQVGDMIMGKLKLSNAL